MPTTEKPGPAEAAKVARAAARAEGQAERDDVRGMASEGTKPAPKSGLDKKPKAAKATATKPKRSSRKSKPKASSADLDLPPVERGDSSDSTERLG